MLTFLKKHSSIISRLMITQLGMAIFGLTVTLAATAFNTSNNREDPLMILVASGFSILFYLFLLAFAANEAGIRDQIRIEAGRMEKDAYLGLKWGLAANVINFLFAAVIIVTYYLTLSLDSGATKTIYATCYTIAKLIQGPYIGVMSVFSPDNPVIFAFVPIPGILASGLGYFLGLKGFMLLPEKRKK